MKTNPEIKSPASAKAAISACARLSPRRLMHAFCLFLFLTVGCLSSHAAAWSRGRQIIDISRNESDARAQYALQAEGYRGGNQNQGDLWVGYKDNHTVFILLNELTPNRVLVNIVVFSEGEQNGGVPGALREVLQQRMATPASVAVAPRGSITDRINAIAQNGAFTNQAAATVFANVSLIIARSGLGAEAFNGNANVLSTDWNAARGWALEKGRQGAMEDLLWKTTAAYNALNGRAQQDFVAAVSEALNQIQN